MQAVIYTPEMDVVGEELVILARAAQLAGTLCKSRDAVTAALSSATQKKHESVFFTVQTELDFAQSMAVSFPGCRPIILLAEPLKQVAKDLPLRTALDCFLPLESTGLCAQDVISAVMSHKSKRCQAIEHALVYGTEVFSSRVFHANDKHSLLASVARFITQLGADVDEHRFGKTYAHGVERVLDELILNAIFHPNPRLARLSRENSYFLSPEEAVTVRWGFDGAVFALSVADPFGSLERHTVMKHLSLLADREKNDGAALAPAGSAEMLPEPLAVTAGLGLRTVFKNVHSMRIQVRPQVSTEIVCALRFDPSLAAFNRRLKLFHYFSY